MEISTIKRAKLESIIYLEACEKIGIKKMGTLIYKEGFEFQKFYGSIAKLKYLHTNKTISINI